MERVWETTRDVGVVTSPRKLHLGATRTASKDVLCHVCTDGPKQTARIGQFGDITRLPTTLRKKRERWIVRGLGDTDLPIGDGHLALGCGDVWAALEQIRMQAAIRRRRLRIQNANANIKVPRTMLDQHRSVLFK